MKLVKRIPLLMVLLSLLTCGLYYYGTVNANSNDTPPPFEKILLEIGYKSVDVAVDDFEQHFNQELILPLRVPPISFTHYLGRFNDLEGEVNDTLEVKFISERFPNNHFKIDVRPLQYKIPFEKYKSKVFKLKNGNDAIYIENQRFPVNFLVFETVHWQYAFGIDRNVSDVVTPEILVQIADSIDF